MLFVVFSLAHCNNEEIKNLNLRIKEMEYKVSAILQDHQAVNEIKGIQVEIETLYDILKSKSDDLNNLQAGLFF